MATPTSTVTQAPPAVELEHAIGYNAGYGNCVSRPGGSGFLYVAGGCIVSASADTPHEQRFLRGTEETLGLLVMSHGGKRIVTAQASGAAPDVLVWCAESERILFRITEHDHGVAAVAVSPDDKLLLTVGNHQDRRVVVWDMSSGGMVAVSQIPSTDDQACVTCCAWGGRVEDVKRRPTDNYHFMLASGTTVHRFHVCPFKEGVMTPVRTNTGNLVRHWSSAAYSRHGDLLFLGSETGDVCVVETAEGLCVKTVKVFNAGVRYIVCEDPPPDDSGSGEPSSDFQYARYGGHSVRSTTLRIGGTGGELHQFLVPDHSQVTLERRSQHQLSGPVNSISRCGDGVFAGTASGDIYKVQDTDGSATHLSTAPLGPVATIAFPPNRSDTFASGSNDGVFRVWDLSTYFEVCRGGVGRGGGRRARGTQYSQAVLAEGKFGGQGGGVGGRHGISESVAKPCCIVYVGQCDTALTGWSDGSIRCLDTVDGEMHWEVQHAHTGSCTCVVISSDLSFFVTASDQGDIKVWSLQTHSLLRELKEHKSKVTSLQLFNNDTHLLSSSHDRSILTWQLTTGQRVATNMLQMGQVNSMFLCKNQQNFITTGTDKKVSLWDTRQHEPVRQAPIGTRYTDIVATTISGSNSDRYFATGGTDQVVSLWDQSQFRPLQSGIGHTGTINQVLFSPDDRQILSCGDDRSILVWNFYDA